MGNTLFFVGSVIIGIAISLGTESIVGVLAATGASLAMMGIVTGIRNIEDK